MLTRGDPSRQDRELFVGRRAERAALEAAVGELRAGAGAAVLVEGEAGVGKSALIDEVLAEAGRRGVSTLCARAAPLERELPFAVTAALLGLAPEAAEPDRAALGRLLRGEVPAGTDPTQARYRIVEGAADLVERLRQPGPLLLVVDDLHWVDDSSLLVIDRLARRLPHLPIGLFATTRPYPVPPSVETFAATLDGIGGLRLPLGPLPQDDVEELVAGLTGGRPGGRVAAAVSAAAGNPLFVRQVLATLATDGATDRATDGATDGPTADAPGRDDEPGWQLPSSLRAVCRRRLELLPRDTQELLRVAAVLGTSFDVPTLATLTQRSAADVVAALEPALREGLVGESGQSLGFRHELVREVTYRELSAAARRGLHADAARALGDAGHPPRQLAVHLLQGAPETDERAVTWLRQAAEETAGAPDVATRLLRRAADLAPRDHPESDRVRTELARVLLRTGRPEEAETLARDLVADERPHAERPAMRALLVQALIARGRLDQALSSLRHAGAEPEADEGEQARWLAELALAWAHTGAREQGVRVAGQALATGERLGDDYVACVAATALTAMSFFRGDAADALRHGERALALAARSDDPALNYVDPGFAFSVFLAFADRHERAREIARRGLAHAERTGMVWGLPAYHGALGVSHLRSGEWESATSQLETAVSMAGEVGYRFGLVYHLLFLTRLAVHRGDLDAARAWVAAAERERADTADEHPAFPDHAAGLLACADGDPDRGVVLLQRARAAYATGYPVFILDLGPALVRPAVSTGRGNIATDAAAEVERLAARWDTGWATGQALRCRALADADAATARRAVDTLERAGVPHDLAGACEEAADLLAHRGTEMTEAAALLRRAVTTWEDLGARHDAARVARRLRDLGVGRGARATRARPDTGWAALTDTEWRIVELVADGLMYRDIAHRFYISRRTVETHVTHVFGKLGISSRAQLAAAYTHREG